MASNWKAEARENQQRAVRNSSGMNIIGRKKKPVSAGTTQPADLESAIADQGKVDISLLRDKLGIDEPTVPKKIRIEKDFEPNDAYLAYFPQGERPVPTYGLLNESNIQHYKFLRCPRQERCIDWAIKKNWVNYSCRHCPIPEKMHHRFQTDNGGTI